MDTKISQTEENINDQELLQKIMSFTEMANGMKISDIIKNAEAILESCGDGTLELIFDNYFGNSVNLRYERDETPDEAIKREVKKAATKIANKKAAATRKKNKLAKDLKELTRLQTLYGNSL